MMMEQHIVEAPDGGLSMLRPDEQAVAEGELSKLFSR